MTDLIGGVDVVLEAADMDPQEALVAGVRQVRSEWPHAVIQDGDSGRLFVGLWQIPFSSIRELMLFRDSDAFSSWSEHGAVPSNAHSMVHLIAVAGALTVVVDDDRDVTAARIIGSLRSLLGVGISRAHWSMQEAA